jgi:hypothetical protein
MPVDNAEHRGKQVAMVTVNYPVDITAEHRGKQVAMVTVIH